jgi:hypothetical protein
MESEMVQQEEAGGPLAGWATGLFIQLPHHRLLDAVMPLPACIELVDLLKRLKLTNSCLCMPWGILRPMPEMHVSFRYFGSFLSI